MKEVTIFTIDVNFDIYSNKLFFQFLNEEIKHLNLLYIEDSIIKELNENRRIWSNLTDKAKIEVSDYLQIKNIFD